MEQYRAGFRHHKVPDQPGKGDTHKLGWLEAETGAVVGAVCESDRQQAGL